MWFVWSGPEFKYDCGVLLLYWCSELHKDYKQRNHWKSGLMWERNTTHNVVCSSALQCRPHINRWSKSSLSLLCMVNQPNLCGLWCSTEQGLVLHVCITLTLTLITWLIIDLTQVWIFNFFKAGFVVNLVLKPKTEKCWYNSGFRGLYHEASST